jgi:hypothetical protein
VHQINTTYAAKKDSNAMPKGKKQIDDSGPFEWLDKDQFFVELTDILDNSWKAGIEYERFRQ